MARIILASVLAVAAVVVSAFRTSSKSNLFKENTTKSEGPQLTFTGTFIEWNTLMRRGSISKTQPLGDGVASKAPIYRLKGASDGPNPTMYLENMDDRNLQPRRLRFNLPLKAEKCRNRRLGEAPNCICSCLSSSQLQTSSLRMPRMGADEMDIPIPRNGFDSDGTCYCDSDGTFGEVVTNAYGSDNKECEPVLVADCCADSPTHSGADVCQDMEEQAAEFKRAYKRYIQSQIKQDCFTGDSLVRVLHKGQNTSKRADSIRRGDQVIVQTPLGDTAVTVRAVKKDYIVNGVSPVQAIDVLRLPSGLGITYTHPIKGSDGWMRPRDFPGARPESTDSIYNFVLEGPYGAMYVNDMETVYIGHALAEDPGLQSWGRKALDYYGNYTRVIEYLSKVPGWDEGYILNPYIGNKKESISAQILV